MTRVFTETKREEAAFTDKIVERLVGALIKEEDDQEREND